MKKVSIKAFGAYVPERAVSNDDLAEVVDTSDEWIYSRTGIRNRYISVGENTSHICGKAADKILKNAGVSPNDIDMIIVATMTPDYLTPATSCIVQNIIGASNAVAFDINAACSGFVYALSIASKFIMTGAYKNVLVLGGENLSKVLNWEDRSTCVLFGDGAGGVLLTEGKTHCFVGEDIHSEGSKGACLTAGHLPVKNPYVKPEVPVQKFHMDGRAVFDFATKKIPVSIAYLLEMAGVTTDEIDWIITHQANSRIVEGISKKMKVDISKFYMNMSKFGNTSAGSIPIALAEMEEKGLISIGSGQKLVLAGFGGGLTWGSLLIQI